MRRTRRASRSRRGSGSTSVSFQHPSGSARASAWLRRTDIPTVETIGGDSLTSLPSQLPVVELAVKASPHPPAAWVTNEAKVGDRVQLRVGGEFVYAQPEPEPEPDGGQGAAGSPRLVVVRAAAAPLL